MKTLQVSALLNGKRSVCSKPCETIEEAVQSLETRIESLEKKGYVVHTMKLVAGRRGNEKSDQYGIAAEG